ncbi:MAG: hypothetical protein DRG83_04470 [Deltaproteobacteria bacterium]|nr:MAG: hypothetical protein DRG83_04470 [Deltaproteobacteria bacterium]
MERLREVLERLAYDEPWGYRKFTSLQVSLRVPEKDIDDVIDRILSEYEPEYIVDLLVREFDVDDPLLRDLAWQLRDTLPVDTIMKVGL